VIKVTLTGQMRGEHMGQAYSQRSNADTLSSLERPAFGGSFLLQPLERPRERFQPTTPLGWATADSMRSAIRSPVKPTSSCSSFGEPCVT
jgi:hypothetical protein